MADVFISYARSTEPQAQQIAKALRELGYNVWRDDDLPAHRDYTTVIEEHLHAAKAVVVAWSAEAVKSRWVCAEADVAHEAGILVQLTLDGSTPPLPFNRIQCADMNGWQGEADAPGWRKVVASVVDLVGADGPDDDDAAPAAPTQSSHGPRPLSGAAARWVSIESSLDPDDYADFLHVFPQSEQAFEARRQKRRLDAWRATDQSSLTAVNTFLRAGSYPALQAAAKAVAEELVAAAERAKQAAAAAAPPPLPSPPPPEVIAAPEPVPAAPLVEAAAIAAMAAAAQAEIKAPEPVAEAPPPEPEPAPKTVVAAPEPSAAAEPEAEPETPAPEPEAASAPESEAPAPETEPAIADEAAVPLEYEPEPGVGAAPQPVAVSEPVEHIEAEPVSEAELQPAAQSEAERFSLVTVEPTPAKKSGLPLIPIIAGVAVIAGLAVGGVVLMGGQKPAATAPANSATAPAPGPVAGAPTPTGPVAAAMPPLDQDASALIAAAQHSGRPGSEIATLSASAAKITAVLAQIKALPPTTAAPDRDALVAQLNALASGMAATEATTIDRTAGYQLQEATHTLAGIESGGASEALDAARKARANVSAAAAAVTHAASPEASLQAAQQVLSAYSAFASADAATGRFAALIAPAKRDEFARISAQAHGLAAQVTSLAATSKPWFLASQSRKTAYQQLQTNLATAKSQIAELDGLSGEVASQSDPAQLDRLVGQANSIRQTLSGLVSSSTAAAAATSGGGSNPPGH